MIEQLINQQLLSETTHIIGILSAAVPIIIGHIIYDFKGRRQIVCPEGQEPPEGATNIRECEDGGIIGRILTHNWTTKGQSTIIVTHTHDKRKMNVVDSDGPSYKTTM